MKLEQIGFVETPYLSKFGIPRQPELASDIDCTLVVDIAFCEPELLSWLAPGCYLWVIWAFSHNEGRSNREFSATVRPPRLGGAERMGVFATRSSFRPNALAISALQVLDVPAQEASTLRIGVKGADMVNETPVYGLRPYVRALDAHEQARAGWVERAPWKTLDVAPIRPAFLELVPERLRSGFVQMLAQDPRPAYTRTGYEQREFWVPFADVVVFFEVRDETVHVTRIAALDAAGKREIAQTGTLSHLSQIR